MNPELNNQTLLAELKKSKLDPTNKYVLESLVPMMGEGQRMELNELIQKSHKVGKQEAKGAVEKARELHDANQTAEREISQLEKDTAKTARKELEALDVQKTGAVLAELENDIKK